jgi:hypothetical protein
VYNEDDAYKKLNYQGEVFSKLVYSVGGIQSLNDFTFTRKHDFFKNTDDLYQWNKVGLSHQVSIPVGSLGLRFGLGYDRVLSSDSIYDANQYRLHSSVLLDALGELDRRLFMSFLLSRATRAAFYPTFKSTQAGFSMSGPLSIGGRGFLKITLEERRVPNDKVNIYPALQFSVSSNKSVGFSQQSKEVFYVAPDTFEAGFDTYYEIRDTFHSALTKALEVSPWVSWKWGDFNFPFNFLLNLSDYQGGPGGLRRAQAGTG